ncbi:MAG: NAD(P)/FAD-dependent oxidoreductase, partial [Bilophila wadsworthia]
GLKPIALDVPTECDQMHFCAICDGAPYKGKRVLVVGGGNSAFDEGLYLLNLGVAELTVVEIMDRFFAAEATQDALLGDPRVKGFKTTKVVDVEVTDGKLSAAILENAQTGERTALPVDGIFVFLGQSPNNEWFKDAIALDDKGYILAGEDMSTNIPGVFGAAQTTPYRQIHGGQRRHRSALAAERWLRTEIRFMYDSGEDLWGVLRQPPHERAGKRSLGDARIFHRLNTSLSSNVRLKSV